MGTRIEVAVEAAESGADHRANVYVEPRDESDGGLYDEITGVTGLVVYRASSLGHGCIRSLVASRMGVDEEAPPDWLLERYDEGTVSEGVILNRAFDRGGDVDMPVGDWKMLSAADASSYLRRLGSEDQFPHCRVEMRDTTGQFTYEIPCGKGIVIRGHLDGVAELFAQKIAKGPVSLGRRANVEVKALGESMLADWKRKGIEAFPGYAWQVSLGMYALGGKDALPTLMLVGEKLVDGKGEDREFKGIGGIDTVLIEEMPVGIGKIKARVAKIEAMARGELPACDKNAYPCPHYFLHDGETRDSGEYNLPVVKAGDVEEELVDAITAYQAGGLAEKKGKAAKDAAKKVLDKLVEQLGVQGGGRVEMSTGVLEWKVEVVAGGTFERKEYTKRYPAWKGNED